MDTIQKETSSEFTNLLNVIYNADMSSTDKMNIINALARYIENDTKILNNITIKTWNADTKQ